MIALTRAVKLINLLSNIFKPISISMINTCESFLMCVQLFETIISEGKTFADLPEI